MTKSINEITEVVKSIYEDGEDTARDFYGDEIVDIALDELQTPTIERQDFNDSVL